MKKKMDALGILSNIALFEIHFLGNQNKVTFLFTGKKSILTEFGKFFTEKTEMDKKVFLSSMSIKFIKFITKNYKEDRPGSFSRKSFDVRSWGKILQQKS